MCVFKSKLNKSLITTLIKTCLGIILGSTFDLRVGFISYQHIFKVVGNKFNEKSWPADTGLSSDFEGHLGSLS